MPANDADNEMRSNHLGGTHDQFSWLLPCPMGRVRWFILKLLFSHLAITPDQTDVVRRLPQDAIVIYVTKHKSRLERLFLHFFYGRQELPCPEIGFFYRTYFFQPLRRLGRILLANLNSLLRRFRRPDPFASGWLARELAAGRHGMLSLVETNEFYRRYVKSKPDPLEFLLQLQAQVGRPIWLVPHLLFYSTGPMSASTLFMGSDPRPGLLRRLWKLILNPEKILVEISEPVSLQAFEAEMAARQKTTADGALVLRHRLLDQITRHRQSITGPILKPMEEIKQHLLTTESLRTFMRGHAKRRNISLAATHREALRYVDEIAAQPRGWMVKLGLNTVHWLMHSMFNGLSFNADGLEAARRASRQGPLVLIPCHKSHMDYLVLSYMMQRNNMPCPHIFAGANLSFWPVGPIFRRLGAFFVRRSFAGAVFYAKVFAEYIHMLLGQGFNIEVFIEGTRSRNGKLLVPKLGMLSIVLNAVQNGACETLSFVPIYVGYDRVPEEGTYLHEIEGGQKEPENLQQVLRARRLLKKRFGKIYIKFCAPIPLSALENEYGSRVRDMSARELRTMTRDLGGRVLRAIDQQTVVTPQSLVAAALLNSAHKIIGREQLQFNIDTFLAHLDTRRAVSAESLVYDAQHAVAHILKQFTQQKFIKPFAAENGDAEATQYLVQPGKRAALEYYKNNGIAPYVPAALTAIAVLSRDAFQFTSQDLHPAFRFVLELFRNEFTLGSAESPEAAMRKTIKAFMEDAIVVPHPSLPDTYLLTSEGFRKLKCFAGFLAPLFESYLVVLREIAHTPSDAREPEDRLKEIQARGNRMFKRQEIVRPEALSKIYYLNAVDFCLKSGMRGSEDQARIAEYTTAVQLYLKHLPV